MYIIALCDDEQKEYKEIGRYIMKYRPIKEMEYKFDWHPSAEALLSRMKEEGYAPDLLLLDIYMPGKTGIEAAEEIRQMGKNTPIIFLTTSTEHALKAYGVDAIQYLVKPIDEGRFFHAMDAAIGQMREMEANRIVIKTAGGIRQIQLDDIVYCESQKNYQILRLASEEYRARLTAGKMWELLEKFPQFGRCGRSYILNMNHIVSVEREEIVMDNGNVIYIPRNKAAEFRKVYFSYYFDHQNDTGGGIS